MTMSWSPNYSVYLYHDVLFHPTTYECKL